MRRSAVKAVDGRAQAVERRHVGMEMGRFDHKDLVVGEVAEDAGLLGNWKKVADMGAWILGVAEQGHSERSESYQG